MRNLSWKLLKADHDTAKTTLEMAMPAISPLTGIIKDIHQIMIHHDEPKLFHFIAEPANTNIIFSLPKHFTQSANGGSGVTSSIAISAAIGESFERYSLRFYDSSRFIFSSYRALQTSAVDPLKFAIFSDLQYKKSNFFFHKFTRDSKVNWVHGYSLCERKSILIPACFCYIPYLPSSNEENIIECVSTGAACGRYLEESILKGIYEVVERDALMIFWLNKLPCPMMDLSSGKWINRLFQEIFLPSNLEFHVINITMDLNIPTMLGLIIDREHDGLALSVGSAANLDPEKAALKALVEATQGRIYQRYTMRQKKKYHDDFSNIKTFKDHTSFYSKTKSLSYLNFIFRNVKKQRFEDISPKYVNLDLRSSLSLCINNFRKRKMDIVYVDLTTIDILHLGFHVTMVIIPGLQELNADHSYRFLGGKRLYETPKILGYTNKITEESSLNSAPHPFP